MSIFDQVHDRNLERLPVVFKPIMGAINTPPRDFIEEHVLPALASTLGDNFHIVFNPPPEVRVAVINTPFGKGVMKVIRQRHGEYIRNFAPRDAKYIDEDVLEDEIRERMAKSGLAFALDNERLFPVSDPAEAMLSLLYALGQRNVLEKQYPEIIRRKVVETLGESVVKEIEDFISALQNGMKEFIDPVTNKRIIVTIEDFCNNAKEAQEAAANKNAALLDNPLVANSPLRKRQREEILKYSGMTQTSLLKLADSLVPYRAFDGVENFINLLKTSMRIDRSLTIGDPNLQKQLLAKLSEIFKGVPGINENWLKSLVYNTKIPSEEPAIIHIEGYPIDVKKIETITFEQASKAITPAVAEMIFDDEKKSIDLTKFTEFISKLINRPGTPAEKDEIHDRVIDPILREFAPDPDASDEIGIPKR